MRILMVAILLILSGCLQHVMHQGNVLKPELVAGIQEGDSRFHVESVLGTPVLRDVLHPNRSIYAESYKNPDTGKSFLRRVEITYDQDARVASIRDFGFKEKNR
ncbi:MAG: outer membrane protein assembly factor BamE [Mariprofundaceae bacterium]|nr:outer membrane protein assembly factor BamE [Mariprofundaceae bacterium]